MSHISCRTQQNRDTEITVELEAVETYRVPFFLGYAEHFAMRAVKEEVSITFCYLSYKEVLL